MKKISLFILVFIFSVISKAQQPVIVSPQWLNENLKDPSLVILYTGFVIRDDYDKEHIEGSRFLWPEWLAFNKPEGNMFAPDPETATRVLQDLGINKDSKIVISEISFDYWRKVVTEF